MSNASVETPTFRREADVGSGPVTVVLAGHDSETTSDIRATLERDGFSVVAEAHDAVQVVGAVLSHQPQICLLEVDLPGNSIGAIREMRAQQPETRIGMLADSATENRTLRAIRAGADGVLATADAPDRLITWAHVLAQGQQPLPRALTARLVEEWRTPHQLPARKRSRVAGVILYVPRFARHFWRRWRSRMGPGRAWASARNRMRQYR